MDDLQIKKNGHVLYITIHRPEKKNALSPELLVALADTLDFYAVEAKTLIPVICGSGDQFFSSGYDISRIPTMADSEAQSFANHKPLDRAVEAIANFPYPVIAALNGAVYGGACELVFACDFRFAAENVMMSMPPARLGLVYSLAGLRRMRNVIGLANLKKMIFTAGRFSGDELFHFGAVDKILPREKLREYAEETAVSMGELSPISLQGHKKIFGVLEHQWIGESDEALVKSWIEKSYLSQDAREGKAAFLEKRRPDFQGK